MPRAQQFSPRVNQRRPGIVASSGVAVGPAVLVEETRWDVPRSTCEDASLDMQRLEQALERSRLELEQVREGLEKRGAAAEAEAIDAQVLFLQDQSLIGKAAAAIHANLNAEAAWMDAIEDFAARIESLPNPTLAERATDVRDAGHRVLSHLQDKPYQASLGLDQPSIILAGDLTPSQTALLDRSQVLGFCTARG